MNEEVKMATKTAAAGRGNWMSDNRMCENWMREAIAAARKGWGDTHPNPCVGAVIVEDGHIVARGWHERTGAPHAEINALRTLGRRPAAGATLVVTLEPCCTHGRTGACTEAILAAGIRNVIAGATDPFPAHAGRGFEVLRQAGVCVTEDVLAAQCADLNLIFNHRVARGGVFVALKTAASLDGRIATSAGESRWITGAPARTDVMRWRRYFPAIATSSTTTLADNPRLTCRRDGETEWCPRARFIFDRRLRTAARAGELRVFNDAFASRTIVVTAADATPEARDALEKRGIRIWQISRGDADAGEGNSADGMGSVADAAAFFAEFKARCDAAGLGGVYVEGGGAFLGAWLRARAADYLFHYVAPKIFADGAAIPAYDGNTVGRLAELPALANVRHESFGADILVRGNVAWGGAG